MEGRCCLNSFAIGGLVPRGMLANFRAVGSDGMTLVPSLDIKIFSG